MALSSWMSRTLPNARPAVLGRSPALSGARWGISPMPAGWPRAYLHGRGLGRGATGRASRNEWRTRDERDVPGHGPGADRGRGRQDGVHRGPGRVPRRARLRRALARRTSPTPWASSPRPSRPRPRWRSPIRSRAATRSARLTQLAPDGRGRPRGRRRGCRRSGLRRRAVRPGRDRRGRRRRRRGARRRGRGARRGVRHRRPVPAARRPGPHGVRPPP